MDEKPWQWRVVKAQLLVRMVFEEENKRRSLRRIHTQFGKCVCCVGYETFVSYLDETKYDISDLVPPKNLIDCLWELVLPFREVTKEAPNELEKRLSRPLPERKAAKSVRKKREAEERKLVDCLRADEKIPEEAKRRVPEPQLS